MEDLKKVLFIGNGIHRAFNGEKESWWNLLMDVCREMKLSFSEFPSNEVSLSLLMSFIKSNFYKNYPKGNFYDELNKILKKRYDSPEYTAHLNCINNKIWNCFDTVITTNVESRFENQSKPVKIVAGKQTKNSTFRKVSLKYDGREKELFYIHGNIRNKKTLCFEMTRYLSEARTLYGYVFEDKKEEKHKAACYSSLVKGKTLQSNESWIECIFFRDVDIIGQSLSSDELDVWWALNFRKIFEGVRSQKQTQEKLNTIRYFYPSFENSAKDLNTRMLLNSLNVNNICIPCSSYREFYDVYFKDYAPTSC